MSMIWTVTRALHAAAMVTAVTGLHGTPVRDKGNDALDFHAKLNDGSTFYDPAAPDDGNSTVDDEAMLLKSGAGSVAALDPRIIRANGDRVHITKPGHHLMVGIPKDLNMAQPNEAQLMIEAHFEKLTTQKCEDLMIRSITIQGSVLGGNITKLEFFIASDVFPDPVESSSPVGLKLTNLRENGAQQTLTFSDVAPLRPDPYLKPFDHYKLFAVYCMVYQPRGYIKQPTMHSNKFRNPLWIVECKPNYEQHNIKVVFNSVWRGTASNGRANLKTDMSLYVTNVGADPAGLMGRENITEETAAIPGCNKAQPVDGTPRYVVDGVRRHPKGKPRHHAFH